VAELRKLTPEELAQRILALPEEEQETAIQYAMQIYGSLSSKLVCEGCSEIFSTIDRVYAEGSRIEPPRREIRHEPDSLCVNSHLLEMPPALFDALIAGYEAIANGRGLK
jgi:hypothetical protein